MNIASIQDVSVVTRKAHRSDDLWSFTDAFFRAKRPILIACFSFSIAFVLVLVIKGPVYRSEALVLVKSERTDVPLGQTAPGGAPDVSDAQLGTELQLLQSRELKSAILRETEHTPPGADVSDEELRKFGSAFKVALVPKSNLIRVAYMGHSRERAYDVLETAVQKYLDYHVRVYQSNGSSEFFNAQAAKYRQDLQAAQEKLVSFEKRNRISILPEQKDLALHRLTELKAELNEAETSRLEDLQRQTVMANSVVAAPVRIQTQKREVPNQYLIEHLGAALVDLRNKRTALLTRYNANDRLVQEVDRQIAETGRSLDDANRAKEVEQSSDVNPLRQSMEVDLSKSEVQVSGETARTTALRAEVNRLETQLGALDSATTEDENLQLDAKEAAENYALYSRKGEEARISGALDRQKISNVTLAEAPTVSSQSDPRLSLASVFGLLLGNAMITGLGLFVTVRRPTIRAPWELEAVSNLPVIATIPNGSRTGKELL